MKRFAFIMCLILILPLLLQPVCAQTTGEAYNELSSDSFREAYRLLDEGISTMAPVITFPAELGIRFADIRNIARAVCLDHPEYFWFLESWFYEFSEDGKYLVDHITPTYYLDKEQVSAGSQSLADAMIAFSEKVDQIITGIPVNCTSDYDIALYLHDYLAENVTYTLEGDHDSAYAALIHGRAACYGYSKAYQYLLSRAGVRSRIIVGDSLDFNGTMGRHAWNQVWIDGECFYTDVTWDDLEEVIVHPYFLVSLEQISQDHFADEMFALPSCDHSIDYFQRSAGKGVMTITEKTTGKKAAEYFYLSSLDGNEAVFVCEARFQCGVNAWLDQNAADIISTLFLSYKTELSYYYFDDQYYMILTDPAYKLLDRVASSISVSMTELTLTGAGAQAHLDAQVSPFAAGIRPPVWTTDNASVAVADDDGMVTAVGPGTAVITVTSADGRVSAQCSVTVLEGGSHSHTLRQIGATEPTCTLEGSHPYYLCTGCFHRFADETAEQELTDAASYAKAPTGHLDLMWYQKPYSHYQVCTCGEIIWGTTASHIDAEEDGLCDVCEAEMPYQEQPDPMEGVPTLLEVLKVPLIVVGALIVVSIVVRVIKRRYF